MVMELGMRDEPSVSLKALGRFCGTGAGTAEACRELLREQYEQVKALLSSQAAAVDALSRALITAETLEGDAVSRIIDAHLSIERPESA